MAASVAETVSSNLSCFGHSVTIQGHKRAALDCVGQTLPSAGAGQALSVAFDVDFDFDSDRGGHDVQPCHKAES